MTGTALARYHRERQAAPPGEVDRALAEEFGNAAGNPGGFEVLREVLLPAQLAASRMAAEHQRRYYRAGQSVWLLFPAAIAAVAVGILVPSLGVIAWTVEFVLLLLILVAVMRADRARSLSHWVECRLLSERLRAACLTVACGLTPRDEVAHDPSAADGWIDRAWRETMAEVTPQPPPAAPAATRELLDRWLGRQQEFHQLKAAEAHWRGKALERAGHLVFALAIGAALLHVILGLAHLHPAGWEPVLIFAAITLPGAGAALGGFRNHREYSRLAHRSRTMAAELAARRAVLAAAPADQAADLVREVERSALVETHEWHGLMKTANVEAPG
jgi:hypothetical protein